MNALILLGGLIGYAFGRWNGFFTGALIGWATGLLAGLLLRRIIVPTLLGRVQRPFIDAAFAVMGALCKADGQVSADEIRVAEAFFERLRLDAQGRERARRAFARGKAPQFDVEAEVMAFARAVRGNPVMLQLFLQLQLSAVAADGQVHPAERALLQRIAQALGLGEAELQWLEALLRGAHAGAGSTGAGSAQALDDAYRVLGVSPEASDADLKQAYRRLMSQHHPDKLAAKGLPESMREMAEQRTREISAAYDRIERARRLAA